MKTLKFSIEVKCIDSYIYSGHIFLVLNSGEIVYAPFSKIIRKLVNNYPGFENLIRLTFQRNDYMFNRQGQMFLGIGELRTTLICLWERASSEMQFTVPFDINDYKVISVVPSMPVLDMRLYAMRMYLGCKEGLYEIDLKPEEERYFLNPSKPEKRFGAKVTHLNAKSGEIVISANSDGLFHGSFLNDKNKLIVVEKPVSKKSVRTGWSSYDIINYEEHNSFEYFKNETTLIGKKPVYSKFDEHTERRRITHFGSSKHQQNKLLERANIKVEDLRYCFNSSSSGFFFTRDGGFITINLNKEDKENPYFTSRNHILPNLGHSKGFSRPISSSIVPNGCVVEYFDKVVLYQNSKAKLIETSPSINVRTYPGSIRYRNLITVTKTNEVSIHSIYPFDELPVKLAFDDFDFTN